jgi:predicted nuclease of predicted toxin-antitoxin system
MKLIADEGVDKQIVDALRNANFDVTYILETNRGVDDSVILELTNSLKAILITQDKDFGELVFRLGYTHYGVILIRLHGYSPEMKASIVVNLLLKHQNELSQSFTVIQPHAIRIRK